MKFRLTVWTSVLWRMILSMNPHTCVGSMLQPFFSKPSFTELFNAISVAIKKQHKNNDIKVNSYKKNNAYVMIDIFTIKFLTRLTTLNTTTKVASGNKTEMQIVRNQFHCHWILKMIRQNE